MVKEIDEFMNKWEEKAIDYYTNLNKQYRALKDKNKQEEEQYKKEHNIGVYGSVPIDIHMNNYHKEIDFLRKITGNRVIEMIIQHDGFNAEKFKTKLQH